MAKNKSANRDKITESRDAVIGALFINEDIVEEAYAKFIEYAWKRCSMFSFTLFHGDLNIEGSFERYRKRHTVTDFDYEEGFDISKSYRKYYDRVSGFIGQIDKQYVIRRYYDVQYAGGFCYPLLEIFAVKLNRKNAELLKSAPSLFSWRPLDLPEDLCMYGSKGCYFLSIAHEETLIIFDASEETKKFLDSINVQYVQREFTVEAYNKIKLKV